MQPTHISCGLNPRRANRSDTPAAGLADQGSRETAVSRGNRFEVRGADRRSGHTT